MTESKTAVCTLLVTAWLGIATAGAAEESPWYLGVGFGETESAWGFSSLFGDLHIPEGGGPSTPQSLSAFTGADFDSRRKQAGLTLGRRVGRYLRLQTQVSVLEQSPPVATFFQGGDAVSDADLRIRDAYSVGVTALPEAPLSKRWSVYAKLGWHVSELVAELDFGFFPNGTPRRAPDVPTLRTDGPLLGGGVLWRGQGSFDFFAEVEERGLDGGPKSFGDFQSAVSRIDGSERGFLFGAIYDW